MILGAARPIHYLYSTVGYICLCWTTVWQTFHCTGSKIVEKRNCLTRNSCTAYTKGGNGESAPQHWVRSESVCWWCANCHFIWWPDFAQSARRIKRRREENNLDSDYQPASMQEGGNVSMATETTSQCHVTTMAVSQQTSSSGIAPACRAACTSPRGCWLGAECRTVPVVGEHRAQPRTKSSNGQSWSLIEFWLCHCLDQYRQRQYAQTQVWFIPWNTSILSVQSKQTLSTMKKRKGFRALWLIQGCIGYLSIC